ncbi:hypothetical protein PybrP1_011554 [[Pythium] brassicae (nom. inval.)]|nr:hypothetical protein PybrP1_011554 [[Pythium] brassicae (nom. inval.)]
MLKAGGSVNWSLMTMTPLSDDGEWILDCGTSGYLVRDATMLTDTMECVHEDASTIPDGEALRVTIRGSAVVTPIVIGVDPVVALSDAYSRGAHAQLDLVQSLNEARLPDRKRAVAYVALKHNVFVIDHGDFSHEPPSVRKISMSAVAEQRDHTPEPRCHRADGTRPMIWHRADRPRKEELPHVRAGKADAHLAAEGRQRCESADRLGRGRGLQRPQMSDHTVRPTRQPIPGQLRRPSQQLLPFVRREDNGSGSEAVQAFPRVLQLGHGVKGLEEEIPQEEEMEGFIVGRGEETKGIELYLLKERVMVTTRHVANVETLPDDANEELRLVLAEEDGEELGELELKRKRTHVARQLDAAATATAQQNGTIGQASRACAHEGDVESASVEHDGQLTVRCSERRRQKSKRQVEAEQPQPRDRRETDTAQPEDVGFVMTALLLRGNAEFEKVLWVGAIEEELASLEANKTWRIVKAETDIFLLHSKGILKKKETGSGALECYKAPRGMRESAGVGCQLPAHLCGCARHDERQDHLRGRDVVECAGGSSTFPVRM